MIEAGPSSRYAIINRHQYTIVYNLYINMDIDSPVLRILHFNDVYDIQPKEISG